MKLLSCRPLSKVEQGRQANMIFKCLKFITVCVFSFKKRFIRMLRNLPGPRLSLPLLLSLISCFVFYQWTRGNVNVYTKTFLESFSPRLKADNWVVVTSHTGPTDDVIRLTQRPDWRVVVVSNNSAWRDVDCVYLGPGGQEMEMFTQELQVLPTDFRREKNLGYLYAMVHGARRIYDTEADLSHLDQLETFLSAPRSPGLMYAGASTFQPFIHFGQPGHIPRGFPQVPGENSHQSFYRLSKNWKTPLIQYGLVSETSGSSFDLSTPPTILPEGIFSPFNSDNTLFLQGAFWALFLPETGTGNDDVIRGYWAQRLLWEIDGLLGFVRPKASRNLKTKEMFDKIIYSELINFLFSWNCSENFSFFGCVLELSKAMATQKYWNDKNVDEIRVWLAYLSKIKYPEPLRVKMPVKLTPLRVNESQTSWLTEKVMLRNPNLARKCLLTLRRGSFVNFSPVIINREETIDLDKQKTTNTIRLTHINQVKDVCKNVKNFSLANLHFRNEILDLSEDNFHGDILLIVVFNFFEWFSSGVKFLELMHRYTFRNIVYCGQDMNATVFRKAKSKLGLSVSFIEADVNKGWQGYHCLTLASYMSYNVSGYLIVQDDTLFNAWNIKNLDKSKVWKQQVTNFVCEKGTGRWVWWDKSDQTGARLMQLLSKWKSTMAASNDTEAQVIRTFFENHRGGCMHGGGDEYYVPEKYIQDVTFMFESFEKSKIFLEVAVPMALHGAVHPDNITFLSEANLWGGERDNIFKFYTEKIHYLHPIKFSQEKVLEKFCTTFLMYQQRQPQK